MIIAVTVIVILIIAAVGVWYITSLGPQTPSTPGSETLVLTQLAAHWSTQAGIGPDPQFQGGTGMPPISLIYETLFFADPDELKEEKVEIIPWLAEGYTLSEDGLTYTIKIKKGVTFHNSGHEVKAVDVKYSIDRNLFYEYPMDIVKSLPWKFTFSLDSVEVVDDYTLQLNMKYPDPTFIESLSMPWFGVVEMAECEAHAKTGEGGLSDHGYCWLNDECGDAGTGPYKIKDFKLMERYELESCEDYWGGPAELNLGKPNIKTIIFIVIVEEVDARMKMERGDLDMIIDMSPEGWFAYKDKPEYKTFTGPGFNWMNLWMHTVSGPLKDWKVRKAIKLAIDYDVIVDEIMLGTAYVSQGALTPTMPGWEETCRYFERDVEAAKALLDEAGYPDPGEPGAPGGWRFSVPLYTRHEPRYGMNFVDFCLSLKNDLAEVGIDVIINVYTVGEFYGKFWDTSFEGIWTPPMGAISAVDPWAILSYMLTEPNCDGWFGFNETTQAGQEFSFEELRTEYQACLAEMDPVKRVPLWVELDKQLLEYGPGVNLCFTAVRVAYTEKLTGFYYAALWALFPAIFELDKTT